jgi:hypothetical protein
MNRMAMKQVLIRRLQGQSRERLWMRNFCQDRKEILGSGTSKTASEDGTRELLTEAVNHQEKNQNA